MSISSQLRETLTRQTVRNTFVYPCPLFSAGCIAHVNVRSHSTDDRITSVSPILQTSCKNSAQRHRLSWNTSIGRIWGYHSFDHKDYRLTGCDVVYSVRYWRTVRRKLLHPNSDWITFLPWSANGSSENSVKIYQATRRYNENSWYSAPF
jgi:hypothetical protein